MSETTNEDRSEWAHTALLAYCKQNRHYEVDLTNEDEFSEVVRDFFADLRHLADSVAGVSQDTLGSWFVGSLEVYEEENAEDEDTEEWGIIRGALPPMPDPTPLPGESDHDAFHRRSLLEKPSSLCTHCAEEEE